MDGNFAMAPRKFLQLYIIRVALGERVKILSVYALMQRKKIDSYNELFGTLVQKCENQIGYILEPNIVIVEFELAAINALTIVQSGVTEIKGCFYHLTQSTWRKVQEFGPVNHYKDIKDFRHFCRTLDEISFLDDVDAGMAYVRLIVPPEANDLVDYFDNTNREHTEMYMDKMERFDCDAFPLLPPPPPPHTHTVVERARGHY